MIPISDNVPSFRKPIVNYLLIGINIALFLWELKLEVSGQLGDVVNSWGVVPARICAVTADALTSGNPATWVAWVLVSSSLLWGMFLHSSFGQILGNLLFLWVFGKNVEDLLGHGQFLLFYLLCGVLTGAVQIIVELTLTVPLIGANGAIAGVLGAYFVSFPKAKIDTILPLIIVFIPIELPALFYLVWWFVQQVFYSIGSLNIAGGVNPFSIAYWAQAGGLLIGAVLIRLLRQCR
ncbi:rhomboid family intramembrane serine protease [Chroococcidiopsis sp. CCMEE 29]|uniref:rhomboid family intramembrane serine protease n=1 Tax=Chroococcidiopsis sp. CCMEE 29 TaxID=155894 RepID=UPI00201FCAAB|nr:rhomboid family intramembrane serine protease [Chroococcidiopsis sp. CCMEE 29]